MKTIPIEELKYPFFAKLAGSTLQVWWGETRLEDFKLLNVTPLTSPGQPPPALDGTIKQYTVNFESAAQRILGQAIYRFVSPEEGSFELFIVAVGRGKDGVLYEAVFNQL